MELAVGVAAIAALLAIAALGMAGTLPARLAQAREVAIRAERAAAANAERLNVLQAAFARQVDETDELRKMAVAAESEISALRLLVSEVQAAVIAPPPPLPRVGPRADSLDDLRAQLRAAHAASEPSEADA